MTLHFRARVFLSVTVLAGTYACANAQDQPGTHLAHVAQSLSGLSDGGDDAADADDADDGGGWCCPSPVDDGGDDAGDGAGDGGADAESAEAGDNASSPGNGERQYSTDGLTNCRPGQLGPPWIQFPPPPPVMLPPPNPGPNECVYGCALKPFTIPVLGWGACCSGWKVMADGCVGGQCPPNPGACSGQYWSGSYTVGQCPNGTITVATASTAAPHEVQP
jgi:hypothetical protein